MSDHEIWVALLPDGTQVLIDRWSDESLTLATRERPGETWGPPTQAQRADVGAGANMVLTFKRVTA